MDICIYSVKANSQAGNIRAYTVTAQKGQRAARYSARHLKNLDIFPRKLTRGPQVQERELLELQICYWEYSQKTNFEIHLPLSYILNETTKPVVHLELCHRNSDTMEKVLNRVELFNSNVGKCALMQVNQVSKTTITWESFHNQGTKVSLLSDELWLIDNSSKNFPRKKMAEFCCLVGKNHVWKFMKWEAPPSD